MKTEPDTTSLAELLRVMARLRDRERGCPWDLEQTFATIAPYTIEEAYEVADAIERNDLNELKGELGDLLFQVVFHARMAEEQGLFAFDDVVTAISEKLERRHPHVFGDEAPRSSKEQTVAWEAIRSEEAYEVADAIERNVLNELKGELRDLLFQVVFHARMAEEQGLFAFDDVVTAISEKLERRHPHVFGDEAQRSSKEQTVAWEAI